MNDKDRWRKWRVLEKGIVGHNNIALIDGCISTEVERHVGKKAVDEKVWCGKASLEYPDEVRAVHDSGLLSGADIIVANTYSTSSTIMNAALISDSHKYTREAVRIAISARDEHSPNTLVAGSLSCHPPLMPAGSEVSAGVWPSSEEEGSNARSHCRILADAGCDVILVEMIWDTTHGTRAIDAACSVGLPVILSFSLPHSANSKFAQKLYKDVTTSVPLHIGGTGTTLLSDAVRSLVRNRPRVVAVTVHHTPIKLVSAALQSIRDGGWTGILGAYPMHGSFYNPYWNFESLDSEAFTCSVMEWVANYGVQIIGVGCGLRSKYLQGVKASRDFLTTYITSYHKQNLHRAVSLRRLNDIRRFADAPDIKSAIGQTALHVASKMGDMEIVSLLLSLGCDTTCKDMFGMTAAETAQISGFPEVRNLIRSRMQGPRKVCLVYLQSSTEQLGLNIHRTEKRDEVRITGVAPGGAGDRSGVVTGLIVQVDGNAVRNLPDVVGPIKAIRESKQKNFTIVIQKDPNFENGDMIEVLQDLIVSGKIAVKKGAVAKVQKEKLYTDGSRRVVLSGLERIDDRSGPLGAMPWEISHVSSMENNSLASNNLVGVYYDTSTGYQLSVSNRMTGGLTVKGTNFSWSPAVISATGSRVTFRGKNGEQLVGDWNGNDVTWNTKQVWSRIASQRRNNKVEKPPAATQQNQQQQQKRIWPLGKLTNLIRQGFDNGNQKTSSQPISRPNTPPVVKPETPPEHLAIEAAGDGDIEKVVAVLSAGVDPDAANSEGSTALHIAAREGLAEMAELLLNYGADCTLRDKHGRCSVDVAALYGKTGLRMRLREAAQGPRKSYSLTLNTPSEKLGLDLRGIDRKSQVLITGVRDNGAAKEAGVEVGLMVSLNAEKISSLADVVKALNPLMGSGIPFELVVQKEAPPVCPNNHRMLRIKGVPESVRAYMTYGEEDQDEDELILACDICEEEDLQNKTSYYHCTQCEHDVCLECCRIGEFVHGRTVDVLSDLIFGGVTAVPAGEKGKVAGVHVDDLGQRRIIVSATRHDGREGPIGALPHEVMISVSEPGTSPSLVPHPLRKYKVVWTPGVKVRVSPDISSRQLGWRKVNDIVVSLQEHGPWIRVAGTSEEEEWMLVEGSEIGLGVLLKPIDGMSDSADDNLPFDDSITCESSVIMEDPLAHMEPLTEALHQSFNTTATHIDGSLWGGTPEQESYRERWKQHWCRYSRSQETFEPSVLEATSRIWVISDIHVDNKVNMSWLESFPSVDDQGISYSTGTLIVAGDVCTKLDQLQYALMLLKKSFQHVFYCVGNHELWQWGKDVPDSVEKFFSIMDICHEEGIQTVPCIIGGTVVVCPLQSWYQSNFAAIGDTAPDKNILVFDGACKWPKIVGDPNQERCSIHDGIGEFFLSLNTPLLQNWAAQGLAVVSFSHFTPRTDLFPGVQRLQRVMGTRALETISRLIGSSGLIFIILLTMVVCETQHNTQHNTVYIFGHSHIDVDTVIEGCRYIQQHLGYARDRKGETVPKPPKVLFIYFFYLFNWSILFSCAGLIIIIIL